MLGFSPILLRLPTSRKTVCLFFITPSPSHPFPICVTPNLAIPRYSRTKSLFLTSLCHDLSPSVILPIATTHSNYTKFHLFHVLILHRLRQPVPLWTLEVGRFCRRFHHLLFDETAWKILLSFHEQGSIPSTTVTPLSRRHFTMLLATLAFVFLAFALLVAVLITVIALCLLAGFSLIIGLALRSTRFAWLSPFFIWIPSLAALFAVFFFGYSAFALFSSWPLPDGPLQFLLLFILGEMFSMGLGTLIALRSRKLKATKTIAPLDVES